MSPQQNTDALTTKRAMQFITTTGEIFGGCGLSQCKMKLHESSHTMHRGDICYSSALLTCLTVFYIFFQYCHKPLRLEGLSSIFHLLNDFLNSFSCAPTI